MIFNHLLAVLVATRLGDMNLWYAIPAIVAVSLVYAATRHEETGPILQHAVRVGAWITGFMLAVFVVIEFVAWLGSHG